MTACVVLLVALTVLVARHPSPVGRIAVAPTVKKRKGTDTEKRNKEQQAKKSDPVAAAADIELYAALIGAGLSPARAAAATAAAASSHTKVAWCTTASLLALGVPAATAWAPLDAINGLADVARQARLGEQTGSALVPGLERTAALVRRDAAAAAQAAAERAGVVIALPLAACFLPAFILLGLVPVVISLIAGLHLA